MSFIDEIKKAFKKSDMLMKLIYINLVVFIIVNIVLVFSFLLQVQGGTFSIVRWFAVPSDFMSLIYKIWTPITYMFLHEDFWHILGNMLWLFFLGRIFITYLGEKKLLSIYLLGGLAGALLYVLSFNLFPAFSGAVRSSVALGASASVTAVVLSIALYKPDFMIRPFGLFQIPLRFVALFFIIYDMVSIRGGNAGGHIAHLGGAIVGIVFVIRYKSGADITKGFEQFLEKFFALFQPKSRMRVTQRKKKQTRPTAPKNETDKAYNARKNSEQQEVDRILDKIKLSGYDSLSKAEKEILFRQGKK